MLEFLISFANKHSEAVFGLLGAFIGATATGVTPFIQDKIKERKNANYLAIRVVNTLREYIYKCWLVAVDDGGERDSGGCLSAQADDPGPIKYPEDIDWKSICPNLAYQLLSLPNKAEAADRSISAAVEFCSGPPDYEEVFEERHLQYSMIGLQVISLEKRLCEKYKIPQENSLEDWDPIKGFQDAIKQVEEAQISRAESQRKLMDDFDSPKGKK